MLTMEIFFILFTLVYSALFIVCTYWSTKMQDESQRRIVVCLSIFFGLNAGFYFLLFTPTIALYPWLNELFSLLLAQTLIALLVCIGLAWSTIRERGLRP